MAPDTALAHRDTPAGTIYFCSTGCATASGTDPHHYDAAVANR